MLLTYCQCIQFCEYCNEELNPDGFCDECHDMCEDCGMPPPSVTFNNPIHIFYACPFLQPFWEHILSLCSRFSIIIPSTEQLKIWCLITGHNIPHSKQPFTGLWLNIHATYIRLIWNHYYNPLKHPQHLIAAFNRCFANKIRTDFNCLLKQIRQLKSKRIVKQATTEQIALAKAKFAATWEHPNCCIVDRMRLTITFTEQSDSS